MKNFLIGSAIALFAFSAMQDANAVVARRRQQIVAQQVAAQQAAAQKATKQAEDERNAELTADAKATFATLKKKKDINLVNKVLPTHKADISSLIDNEAEVIKEIKGLCKTIATKTKLIKAISGGDGKLSLNWRKGKAFFTAAVSCVEDGTKILSKQKGYINMEKEIDKLLSQKKFGYQWKNFFDRDAVIILRFLIHFANAQNGQTLSDFYTRVYGQAPIVPSANNIKNNIK